MMSNPWRSLLLRSSCARSSTHVSTHSFRSQVGSHSNLHTLPSLTSAFCSCSSPQLFLPYPELLWNPLNTTGTRCLSSEAALEPTDHDVFVDIVCKCVSNEEVRSQLRSNNIQFTEDLVLKALQNVDSNPDVAWKVLDWVLRHENGRLTSKCYNSILGFFGTNGFVKEFWKVVETMKRKRFGISKDVQVRVLEKFEQDGLVSDLEKLRGLYGSDDSVEKAYLSMYKIIRRDSWGDDVEERLRGMNVPFSSDLVRMVLDSLSNEPAKALIFFRWVDESGLFKHDERTYNAIARVLGKDDCIDMFWKVVDEMTSAGYEIEAATYFKISLRFTTRKWMKDVVRLYELAMGSVNKPPVRACIFLLKKITTSVVFDIDLFSRVVKVFVERGNVLTNIVVNPVLDYLSSVGRSREFNKVLKAMQECGFVADTEVLGKIVSLLGKAENMDALSEFMDTVEASGYKLNNKTWTLLIQVHCVHGDLDKATDCFLKMLEKAGVSVAGPAFESLVKAYCLQHRALDSCKLLCDLVRDKQLMPRHTTYKALINELFVQGSFKDALNLLDLMKDHQLPDYLDRFIEYVSKTGTAEDAINFLEAMKLDIANSTCVFLRVFEACFKAKRHNEAQDILSKCPSYIRLDVDVLNLFCSWKSDKGASTIGAVA